MSGQISDYKNIYLSGDLDKDITLFKEIFKKDVVLRIKKINSNKKNIKHHFGYFLKTKKSLAFLQGLRW